MNKLDMRSMAMLAAFGAGAYIVYKMLIAAPNGSFSVTTGTPSGGTYPEWYGLWDAGGEEHYSDIVTITNTILIPNVGECSLKGVFYGYYIYYIGDIPVFDVYGPTQTYTLENGGVYNFDPDALTLTLQ